jgi:acid stress-induced BolA-like protein IbaG/YrbA
MEVSRIKRTIEESLPGAEVFVRDFAGDGDHLEAVVIHASFEGKSPLARHRMVYTAIGRELLEELHALKLKTLAPSEAVTSKNLER